MYKSIYEELKANKIYVDTYESTLYVEKTNVTMQIIAKHRVKNFVEYTGTNGKIWYELPNQNIPYFLKKTSNGQNNQYRM